MFVLFTAALLLLLSLAAVSAGPMHALRVGFLCTLFVPTWMMRGIGSMTLDLRLMAVIILVPVAIFGGRWIRQLGWLDGFVLLLTGIGIASLIRSETSSPTEIAVIVCVWIVPYFFGRLLIGSLADLHDLVPWACVACMGLSAWSVFEATTKINPINVLAQRSGSFNSEMNNRMNLRRAEGPQNHPIYFGMTMAMLFPWTLEGARLARSRRLPMLFSVAPLICILGVCGTVSRGPLLVMLVAGTAAAFFYFPFARLSVFVGAGLVAVAAFVAWPIVVESLETVSGEEQEYVVTIDGKEYDYTGTKHRELLYLVYEKALAEAGWMGHGKWGGKNSHKILLEPQLRRQFASIDNHYIMLTLNWGKAGLITFLAMGGYVLVAGGWFAMTVPRDYRLLIGGMTGSIVAVMVFLMTVWLSNDFGFIWLMTIGMLCSAQLVWKQQRAAILEAKALQATSLEAITAGSKESTAVVPAGPSGSIDEAKPTNHDYAPVSLTETVPFASVSPVKAVV